MDILNKETCLYDERGRLSLVSTIEEVLERESSCSVHGGFFWMMGAKIAKHTAEEFRKLRVVYVRGVFSIREVTIRNLS
jgi:hypothetical protein